MSSGVPEDHAASGARRFSRSDVLDIGMALLAATASSILTAYIAPPSYDEPSIAELRQMGAVRAYWSVARDLLPGVVGAGAFIAFLLFRQRRASARGRNGKEPTGR
jgi:hypothetical protein